MSRLPYRNQRRCRVAGRQPWLSPRRTCKKIQIVTIVFSSYSPKAKAGALRPPERFLAFEYLKPIILRRVQLCPDSLVTCRVAQVIQCAGSDPAYTMAASI